MRSKIKRLLTLLTLSVSLSCFAQNAEILNLYNQAKYIMVIDYADSLIDLEKANHKVWLYKGLSHQAIYQYPKAVQSFQKAGRLKPGTDIDLLLAKAWEYSGAEENAIKIYSDILKKDSLNMPALARMASIYKNQRDYLNSTDYYSRLINIDSTNSFFYYQLGHSTSKIGLSEPAASYFFKAYTLNPNDFKSVKGFLNELVKQTRYEEALRYIDSFLYVFPENLQLIKQRAYLFGIGGNYLDAVKEFEKVVEMGDSSLYTCKYFGQSLYNNGNYEQAVYWLDRYLQKKPDDVKNQFIIAIAYQKDYQYQNSLDHFGMVESIIFDKENIAQLHKERAQTYIALGDYYSFRDSTGIKKKEYYDLALQGLNKAEELFPQDHLLFKQLGVFYEHKMKNAPMALYYYQQYYNRLDPQKIKPYQLTWIQDKIGELKEEVHFMGD